MGEARGDRGPDREGPEAPTVTEDAAGALAARSAASISFGGALKREIPYATSRPELAIWEPTRTRSAAKASWSPMMPVAAKLLTAELVDEKRCEAIRRCVAVWP
jgi:hypothetical protein